MKFGLLISALTSILLAGIHETGEDTYIDIFSSRTSTSELIATVSTTKGKIEKKNCFSTRSGDDLCKVVYTLDSINIKGYIDKKSLDIISAIPNSKAFFETTFGGHYDDMANDIISLDDGFLLVGKTQSFGEGSSDAYIIKTDKFGNKVFSAAYGGRNGEVANAVVEMDDCFMVAGMTNSFGNRVQSIYLSKISKTGDFIWQKAYYSDEDDYYSAMDMVRIGKNNLLLAGTEEHVKFFSSQVDFYLTSINTDGQRNGIKRYGGEDPERANSIISTTDGYVIAGLTDTWGHGREDAYVVKIDKDGNRLWHNAYGFKGDETANQIIETKDGGYILVGSSDSDYRNQKGVYVVKLRSDGMRQWQSLYGSRENDEGFGIAEAADGYVVAGYTKGTDNYDSDVYLIKIDKNGNIMWERKYGSSKDDRANAIIKVNGGYAITGYSTSIENYSKEVYLLRVDENGRIN